MSQPLRPVGIGNNRPHDCAGSGAQEAPLPAPLDETFTGLLHRPYQQHLAKAAEMTDYAEFVAAMSPQVLVACISEGTTLALERYGAELAPATSNFVGHWLRQHTELAGKLNARWQLLSGGSLNGLVRGFKASLCSEHAEVGSTLGGLLGGWGSVVGRVVGGLMAVQREDQDFTKQLHLYLSEVDNWFAVLVSDFDRRVLPRIARNLNPWPCRIRWVVTAAFSLGAAAGLAWLLHLGG